MQWHTSHLTETDDSYLQEVYNHETVITLDEVPDIVAEYGPGGGECEPTAIDPYLSVDGGDWQNTGEVQIEPGTAVRFGPHPTDGGSWNWSGNGVAAQTREISLSPDESSTYTATYTNSCGESSSYEFTVTVDGSVGGPSWPKGATDPDGDGKYEDLNGNGRLDSDDIVQVFKNKDSEEMQANAKFYDFNDNGRIDYDDVATLFKEN